MYAQIPSEKTDMLYVRVYISQNPATHKGGGLCGGVMLVKKLSRGRKRKVGFLFFSLIDSWLERGNTERYVRGSYSSPLSMRLSVVCHKTNWPCKWLHYMGGWSSHGGSCHRMLGRSR